MNAIITNDRFKPFDPAEFIGQGWRIDEQDERSLALSEVDLSLVQLVHMLNLDSGERYIQGEEKISRLKEAGYLRLDAKLLQTLWENQHLIPESWKAKTNGDITLIFFDGTILRDPRGDRCVLCLCWSGGKWRWDCYWLGSGWNANLPSGVLANL